MTAVIIIIPTVVPSPKMRRYQSADAGSRNGGENQECHGGRSRDAVDTYNDKRS
ncbi:MAG TPA: hypothetical protein VII30_07805 [Gemmatimonadaceae bacterium]